ncbi:MAG: hypothetical protein JSR18_07975, partial [Proteobacteria bacterium]|nr:hypothetical protein [Pseudomonadota bacterium]
DANGDGIADSLQPSVATLPGGDGYVMAVVTGGGCPGFASVTSVAAPPPGDDPGYRYPAGRVALHLSCGVPGATANVDLVFFGAQQAVQANSVTIRGYGPNLPAFGQDVYFALPASFGNVTLPGTGVVTAVHLTLTDGALGDRTPVDGTIDALVGPAIPLPVATPVPAVSPAWLVLLALAVGALGMRRRASRQR